MARRRERCALHPRDALVCSLAFIDVVISHSSRLRRRARHKRYGSSYAALAINQWNAEVSSEYRDTRELLDDVVGDRTE